MQDRELYEQFLGLSSPWSVERVNLDAAKSEVHVYVEHPRGMKFCCPKCQRELACYDHAAERHEFALVVAQQVLKVVGQYVSHSTCRNDAASLV